MSLSLKPCNGAWLAYQRAIWARSQQVFSIKGQRANVSGFVVKIFNALEM